MLTAIWSACLPNGFFVRDGGLEYPLVLAASTLVLAAEGPGPISATAPSASSEPESPSRWAASRLAAAGSAGVYLVSHAGLADHRP